MKKVIVFGIGKRLEVLMKKGMLFRYEILACTCNEQKMWGKYYRGIDIISPKEIVEYEFDEILISTKKYEAEIRYQLEEDFKIDARKIKLLEIEEDKHEAELKFWRERFSAENGKFNNAHYETIMLGIAKETDESFWENQVVADFGCGPRGSLTWAKAPSLRIGIDVLVPQYLEEFGNNMVSHNMVYVPSNERYIPIPNETIDCLCTINSLDHVENLERMCQEMLRIMKPKALLLASFNLNEPASPCEPQTLTEQLLEKMLLRYFDIETYRLAHKIEGATYADFINNKLLDSLAPDEEGILWVRARKK